MGIGFWMGQIQLDFISQILSLGVRYGMYALILYNKDE